ncbi:MAG: DUF998 domain-containing protein [Ardenticatenaceae bacterium]|nr:DUF998 domain-containing protein [Ardenticatenaceae bacterium]
MNRTALNQRRVAAWAGIIGPTLFVLTFTLEGWLRPGYNPRSMYISALSLGPRGWIQILNFIILGVLLLVFARGVALEFPSGKASRGGPWLLTILAVLFMISGPFVMDPMGTPTAQATVHGIIHGIAGGIVFLLMPITCFVFLRRFRVDPDWHSFQAWTAVLGTIEAVAVIFFTISSKSPGAQSVFEEWFGLIQRTALIPFMFWLLLFALKLLERSKFSPTTTSPAVPQNGRA